MEQPNWAYLNIAETDYQNIQYYSKPKTKSKIGSLDDADPELLRTFEKLGVSLNEQKMLANVAVDAVFDRAAAAAATSCIGCFRLTPAYSRRR